MKAIVQDRYGPPEVLALEEVDRPVAGPGEVLVRVRAASVNARDWHLMRGDPYVARLAAPAMFGRRGPRRRIRGRDFAGQVEEVGAGVTGVRPGDEVFGDCGDADGAFAEYVAVPADLVRPRPAGLTVEQAAALPLAGHTALLGMRDVGRVRAGQQVLVNGASGGVGLFAVQLGVAFGAEVTGVCSPRNAELVRSQGAAHVVDYTTEDFARTGRRHDVVLDLVGNRSLADLRRALVPGGTLVLSGGGVSDGVSLVGPIGLLTRATLLSRLVRDRLVLLTETPDGQGLADLRELAGSGALTPVVDRTYELADVPAAIRYVEREHARAKVVISV